MYLAPYLVIFYSNLSIFLEKKRDCDENVRILKLSRDRARAREYKRERERDKKKVDAGVYFSSLRAPFFVYFCLNWFPSPGKEEERERARAEILEL